LGSALRIFALFFVIGSAHAFPDRPIRIIVPLAAGGTGDTLARLVGDELAKALGGAVIVEDRPGSGGVIGTEAVAKSVPDGHTLLHTSPSHVLNAALRERLPYDPLKDFAPISRTADTWQVLLANPAVPAANVRELIALARTRSLNYGSAGNGSATHLNMELFKALAGVDLVHVPYKGSDGARVGILGGQVQMMIDAITTMAPNVRAGKLKAMGTTGIARSSVLPDVPTIAEAGVPGYETGIWLGLMAPAGTPRPVLERLNTEVVKILNSAEVKEAWEKQGALTIGMSIERFDKFLRDDIAKWAAVVKATGMKVE
jgi:tripartite-type tricarboxylate transporter receptor subunit TctC